MSVEPTLAERSSIPEDPRPSDYQRLARTIASGEFPQLDPITLGILSGSTLDLLKPVLIVEAARAGLRVDLVIGEFGQLEQPLLDPNSHLRTAAPDALLLFFQLTDVAPDAVDRLYRGNGEAFEALTAEILSRLVSAAVQFRDAYSRPVLIGNFALPADLPTGPFDASDPNGLTHRLNRLNAELAQRLVAEPDIYVWDYAGLVRASGAQEWTDGRLWFLARSRVEASRAQDLSRHLVRSLQALRAHPAKCLVLDLDNTIWGGVVGDDGPAGIALGDDWPGSPFKAFQRAALGLRDRGVLLAVASKNDEHVAKDVFDTHPEMLIRWEDLAAHRINWRPKSQNIREIAAELNIGVDSLVLFDDNPVERAEVRANLPEARVVDVPIDPVSYREELLRCGFFDVLGTSDEDQRRADMYKVERQRKNLQREAPTVHDFLESLGMEVSLGRADEHSLSRIGQLVHKTNQFNLSTRRHSPSELERLAGSPDSIVAWLRLSDRFGDQGLVAVGIVVRETEHTLLDTLLMSCRVMNRGVEAAMLAYLAREAAALGGQRLMGEYRPTPKNHMVADLLGDHGFDYAGDTADGTLWSLDLAGSLPEWPEHLAGRPSQWLE